MSISLSGILITLPVNSKVFFLEADYYQDKTQERKIILGKGEIITSDKTVTRVAVSDPHIADLQVLNEKQIFVRAKQLGICTILVWEIGRAVPTRFDVSIWPDIENLTKQLHNLDKNIIIEYITPSSTSISEESRGSESNAPAGGSPQAGGAPASPGPSSASTDQPSTSSSSLASASGKIILKGEVKNAEIIARALQIAGAYVGDQGIKIISQPGGQIVDGLAGKYDINSNSDIQAAQGATSSATQFGARTPISFTTNRYANLSRAIIATTQKGYVLSFLTVKDPPQVSVAIRFYEISRSIARNIGFNTNFGGSTIQGGTFIGGNGISQLLSNISSLANVTEFMASGTGPPDITLGHGSIAGGSFISQTLGQGVTGVIFNPDNGIGLIIQALQERGEIKTLAEPTLVIANGEPASFLAGGEVPILRSVFTAGGASTDVTYEPFGIKFNLLPTVTSNDRIFLQLVPEIRDIDSDLSNFVSSPGSTTVRPPAFKTSRTQTQVELESGQAFAISGLLREDNTRNLRKVPGVGNIPILGTLFRSKSFKKGETELLVVVSPQIVRPTSPDKIAKLSIPEVPYHDFDQLAPRKPFIQHDDEKGPEMKTPLDAGKYNTPESNQTNGDDTSLREPLPKEQKNLSTSEIPFIEKKTKQLIVVDEQITKTLQEKKPDEEQKLAGEKEQAIRAKILEYEKLSRDKEQATPVKDLENKKYNEELKQAKLIKKQQDLKEQWQKELTRYTQAKEAMKLARENKL